MRDIDDLTDLLASWPVPAARVGVTDAAGTLALGGDIGERSRIASVSKLFVAMAALVAVEEGSISLDEAAGPPGSTVRHLLAHAAGFDFDTPALRAAPGTRRIYSNVGIEIFANHLAQRTGMPFEQYLREAVIGPLGLGHTDLVGSPAHGLRSDVGDLLRFARELLAPMLIDPATLAAATTAQFPALRGVLPGIGRFDPNPWGLGFELRADKSPHWTATTGSPRTFGHFGGAGTFLWVDPDAGIAAVALTGRDFDTWALEVWPPFSDAVLARYG